jgi:peptidoglycan/xylan/chitin deacetylase (PgdA/CDA1 family)
MQKSARLIILSSLSITGLLSGCAANPLATQTERNNTRTQAESQSPRVTKVAQTANIRVVGSQQTNSQISFTLSERIQTIHMVSGDASPILSSSGQSVTFLRAKSTAQTVTSLVTAANGYKQLLTFHIPSMTTMGSTVQGQSSVSNKSQTGTSPSVPPFPVQAGTAAPVVYFGPATGRRVYITVDDGWVPSQRVLKLMQRKHVPITTFLIQDAASENPAYWKAFVQAGGVIQDHTVNHPWLTGIPYAQDLAQWQGPVQMYPKWFGQTPTLGRPPYGAIDENVRVAAHNAGLQAIVMWSAEFNPKHPKAGLETWNNKPLSPGEIILLHWQPGLYQQIQEVLAECKQLNLVPAPLTLNEPQVTLTGSTATTGTTATTSTSTASTTTTSAVYGSKHS